ncbi:MAG: hypothetical protein U0744_18225 [Gemmataceae bacterium]
MVPISDELRPHIPADLVRYVCLEAARNGHRLAEFLRCVGLESSVDAPLRLSRGFLIYLAAALRLHAWESEGFYVHQEYGLPPADAAVRNAFKELDRDEADARSFWNAVLQVSIDRFSWRGPLELKADVALDELEDEEAIEMIAQLLWESRDKQRDE